MRADKPPSRPRFVPPTLEEVRAYCQERKNGIDPAYFVDYYTARGWKYNGGQAMKDWKSAIRTWEKMDKDKGPATGDRGRIKTAEEYESGDNFFKP